MVLRMLLVGLVAGLGLELPSRGAIDADTRSGGDGRCAGVAARTGSEDQAFSAVVEEMVTAFAAEAGRGVEAAANKPADEGVDLYPGLAYALNREAEGLSGPIAPVIVAEVVAPTLQQAEAELEVMPPALEAEEWAVFGWETEEAIEAAEAMVAREIAPGRAAELAVMPRASEVEESMPAAELAPGSRGERLGRAIRLTGEAVHAWVMFLQQAPAVVPDRP